MSERTEFGFERTHCDCRECQINCRFMPGFLIPADLDRMIPANADPYNWAEKNLLASPGAVVMNTATGETSRIYTLVPAVKKDGSCINLKDGLCTIHETAPFGCAFFDCGPERENLSRKGLWEVWKAWQEDGLYARLWKYLQAQKFTQKAPEVLRARMREAEA
jgi:hypothetical protein